MAKQWEVKVEQFIFDYDKTDNVSARTSLTQNISNMAIDGWEPWNITGGIADRVEYILVWFRRERPND